MFSRGGGGGLIYHYSQHSSPCINEHRRIVGFFLFANQTDFSLPYIMVYWWAFSFDWKKKLSTIHLCVYVSQILYFILTVSAPKKEYTWNQIKKIDTTKKKNIKHCFYQYIPVNEDINSNLQCRNSSQRAGTYTVWHQMQWASAPSSSACIYLMGIGKMASCMHTYTILNS